MHAMRETGISDVKPTQRAGTHQEILDGLRELTKPSDVCEVCETSGAAGSAPSAPPAPGEAGKPGDDASGI